MLPLTSAQYDEIQSVYSTRISRSNKEQGVEVTHECVTSHVTCVTTAPDDHGSLIPHQISDIRYEAKVLSPASGFKYTESGVRGRGEDESSRHPDKKRESSSPVVYFKMSIRGQYSGHVIT